MSIALGIALFFLLAGFAVWWLRLRPLWRSRDAAHPFAADASEVSIIVPARNEAHNLPALLASLNRLEPAPGEIIVVDDHSDDGTGDIARAAGATVVTPPPLPPGWIGKPWACHHGVSAARGRYLLLTDADTVHAADSLGRALGQLRERGAGLLSVVPTHTCERLWERLQGVFQLLLLIACRAGGTRRTTGERRFSIGQYLLFDRAAYNRIGGHVSVRDRVAEDLAFARMIDADGLGFELLFAPGAMSVRMYPEGFGGFVRGWRRNFREGMAAAGAGGILEITAVLGWLLGAPLTLATAGIGTAFWVAAAATALAAIEVGRRQRALGELPPWSAVLYPVFAVVFVAVSALAVVDRVRRAPVRWRGREVDLAVGGDGS